MRHQSLIYIFKISNHLEKIAENTILKNDFIRSSPTEWTFIRFFVEEFLFVIVQNIFESESFYWGGGGGGDVGLTKNVQN